VAGPPPPPGAGSVNPNEGPPEAAAVLIATGADEYYFGGGGMRVDFAPTTPGPGNVGLGDVQEGKFVDGKWVVTRQIAGDDDAQGEILVLAFQQHRAGDSVPLSIELTQCRFGCSNALVGAMLWLVQWPRRPASVQWRWGQLPRPLLSQVGGGVPYSSLSSVSPSKFREPLCGQYCSLEIILHI